MACMATRFPDADIAATLNRMGVCTGQSKTWTAHRVGSIRKVHGMHAYRSADKDGAWLTMREAAATLGVTSYVIRRMIMDGVLAAEQVVQGAPWQIQTKDLEAEPVLAALARRGRPRHTPAQGQIPMFPDS
jgi:excisionase family DNA binding protein